MATTFIKPPATLAGDAIGASLVGITNTASVTMTGFTVAGPKQPPLTCVPASALTYGVRIMGGGKLNLSDSAVIDIRDNPLSGCQTGVAVRAGSAAFGESGHLVMSNVVITGYQKGGVVISGPGSSGTLNSNTITGYGNQPSIAANSVQISGGAVATVTGNTISANKCDLAGVCTPDPITGTFSSGVLSYDAGAVVLTGNIISDTDAGIYSYAPTTPAVIEGNTLLNNRWHGIYIDEGNTTAQSNTITGSLNGVVVASYLANAGDSNANVYSNTISGATNGVLVVDESITDTLKPVLDAKYNNLNGNTNGVLMDASAPAAASTVQMNNLVGNSIGISNAAPSTRQRCAELVERRQRPRCHCRRLRRQGQRECDLLRVAQRAGARRFSRLPGDEHDHRRRLLHDSSGHRRHEHNSRRCHQRHRRHIHRTRHSQQGGNAARRAKRQRRGCPLRHDYWRVHHE